MPQNAATGGIVSSSSVRPTDCAGSPVAPPTAIPTTQPNTLGGVTVQQGNPASTIGGLPTNGP